MVRTATPKKNTTPQTEGCEPFQGPARPLRTMGKPTIWGQARMHRDEVAQASRSSGPGLSGRIGSRKLETRFKRGLVFIGFGP